MVRWCSSASPCQFQDQDRCKNWPKSDRATRTKTFKVYRWNPDDEQGPRMDSYVVDLNKCGPRFIVVPGSSTFSV